MSVTINILSNLSARLGGETLDIGTGTTPSTVSLDGERYEALTEITNVETSAEFKRVVLWETGNGGLADFDMLMCVSDTDVLLELGNDIAGTPTYLTVQLLADVPFLLASGTMLAAVTVDGAETTMVSIEQIAVQNNNDDESTATVRLILLK